MVKPFLEAAGTLPVTSRETTVFIQNPIIYQTARNLFIKSKGNQIHGNRISISIFIFPVSHFGSIMSSYLWKSFDEDEDRPEKPRRYGVTEMRGPHFTLLSQNVLQVTLMMIVFFISANHDLIIYNNFLLDGFCLLHG